jgi:hypothetical protein
MPSGGSARTLDRRPKWSRKDCYRLAEGRSISFIGVPSGGWFGEGSLLKREPRRYDGIAMRESAIAYVPRNTFMLLLDSSVAFNRFLLVQLNERLGQFVAMVEYDRLLEPDARLAKELAGLFNPVLYPEMATLCRSHRKSCRIWSVFRDSASIRHCGDSKAPDLYVWLPKPDHTRFRRTASV